MSEFPDDGIEIRVGTPGDADGIRNGMKSMATEEPVSKAVSSKITADNNPTLDMIVPLYVNSGLSLVAVDKTTQEFVGFSMSFVETRQHVEANKGKSIFDPETMPVQNIVEKMADILEKHPTFIMDYYNADAIVHLFDLHVIPAYCQRGIASKLVEAAIRLAREKGYKCIRCEATSNYSRKIFERFGFETLNEITFDEYRGMGFELGDTGIHKKKTLHGMKIADD